MTYSRIPSDSVELKTEHIFKTNFSNQAASPNGPGAIDPNDPFQMAPFPVVVAPSSDDRDPFLSAPFQQRSVSKNNPFRPVKEVK